jgi:hypothetical protein
MLWAEYVARLEIRGIHTGFLLDSQKEKEPLRSPRPMWEDTIKMDLKEIGWGCMDWIHLPQDRDQWWALVNTIDPSDSIKYCEIF